MALITVAVVSWNTRELLADCLSSLQDDARGGLVEVWVVDNASSDGSADLVRRCFPWTHLIESKENLGFGAAVNLVARRTKSVWLAPANADIRTTPGALQTLAAEGERHPEAGAIAPRLVLPSGATQHSVLPFPTVPFTVAYAFGITGLSHRLARVWGIEAGFAPDHSRTVDWAVGAFLLVRRRAWEEVAGFDEAHWMYAEDLDLGWRLRRAGWTTRYQPAARMHHAESAAAVHAWGNERYARWHASTYAWLLRRRGPAMARLIAVLNMSGFAFRAGVHTLGVLLGSDRARLARRRCLDIARAHSVGLRSTAELRNVR